MPLVSSQEAIKKLQQNQVVALPTETVYGLAGRIDSETSLKKIFSTKKRPFFDPLIVHVKDLEQAKEFGDFDSVSLALAKEFWPGPLTLVVKRNQKISDLITNGGDTVAFRNPSHPDFLKVLTELGTPLAAPSANLFGKTSPTQASHLIEEYNDQLSVLDGGPCTGGIESTIVKVNSEQRSLEILRPGLITQTQLQDFFEKRNQQIIVRVSKNEVAPGNLKNHYQPKVPLCLVHGELDEAGHARLNTQLKLDFIPWKISEDPAMAARELYRDMRNFDRKDTPIYFNLSTSIKQNANWSGIVDRLQKACHYEMIPRERGWELSAKE